CYHSGKHSTSHLFPGVFWIPTHRQRRLPRRRHLDYFGTAVSKNKFEACIYKAPPSTRPCACADAAFNFFSLMFLCLDGANVEAGDRSRNSPQCLHFLASPCNRSSYAVRQKDARQNRLLEFGT